MIVTTGTTDRHAQESGADCGQNIVEDIIIRLEGIIRFIIVNVKPVEARSDQRFIGLRVNQIPGELFLDELIERFVFVE